MLKQCGDIGVNSSQGMGQTVLFEYLNPVTVTHFVHITHNILAHNHTKLSCKRFNRRYGTLSYFEHLKPYCDLDDVKPNLSRDTPAHDHAHHTNVW